jgi:hypothetical protein
MRRLFCLVALSFLTTGCGNIMHELQPHRMWRMNYTDNPGRTDGAYFSIDDPLTTETASVSESHESTPQSCHSR